MCVLPVSKGAAWSCNEHVHVFRSVYTADLSPFPVLHSHLAYNNYSANVTKKISVLREADGKGGHAVLNPSRQGGPPMEAPFFPTVLRVLLISLADAFRTADARDAHEPSHTLSTTKTEE